MKKILFIITQAEYGGAQRAVFELAAGLKDRFEITVAAGEPTGSDELLRRCSDAGIKTIRLTHLRRAINPIHDILAVFELRRLIDKEGFDLIHAHSSKAGIITSFSNYQLPTTNYQLIYTAHGWVFQEPLSTVRRLIYLWMEKIAARRRAATIVLSESEKKIALSHRLGTDASIIVIPNGVECPLKMLSRDQARVRVSQSPNTRLIGTIANLYPTKGLDTLVAAASVISEKHPDVSFVIVGEGPERKKIEREIRSRNLEKIFHLVGQIPDAEQILPAFDIFILPSRKEGLPFAMLDAAVTGLPIVATQVGGIPEVLQNGTDALLVSPDDPAELSKAIIQLLGDPSLSSRLAASARDRVCQNFNLRRMLESTAELYQRLLS